MRVIRNTENHDEFWSFAEQRWVSRDEADEYSVVEQEAGLLPPNGEWVGREMGLSYKIVRKFKDRNKDDETIKTGLTWAEAREHCSDPSTSGDGWFDAFYEE